MLKNPAILRWPQGGFHPSAQLVRDGVLKAWWNADDHGTANMTDDGSGVISAWVDRIGSMSVTAATTARPTWTATAFNSVYSGLTFDGTANCLVSTSLSTIPTGSTGGETWALIKNNHTGTAGAIVAYGGTTAATQRRVVSPSGGNGFFTIDVSGSGLGDNLGQLFNERVVAGGWDGTIETGRRDGRPMQPPQVTIASLNTGTSRFRIAANTAGTASQFWQGAIRHVMVTTTLSEFQRQRLEGWLAWDGGIPYRLPSDHPFRYVQP